MVTVAGYVPLVADKLFATEYETLEQVRDAARGCKRCDLWKSGTQTVFGEGRSEARLMLVGEQPGDQEDLCRPAVRRPCRGSCLTGCSRKPESTAKRPLRRRGQRRQALQVAAAREATDPPEAECGRDRRLPALARHRTGAHPALGARLPRRDRGPGTARSAVPGQPRIAGSRSSPTLAPVLATGAPATRCSILRSENREEEKRSARGGSPTGRGGPSSRLTASATKAARSRRAPTRSSRAGSEHSAASMRSIRA